MQQICRSLPITCRGEQDAGVKSAGHVADAACFVGVAAGVHRAQSRPAAVAKQPPLHGQVVVSDDGEVVRQPAGLVAKDAVVVDVMVPSVVSTSRMSPKADPLDHESREDHRASSETHLCLRLTFDDAVQFIEGYRSGH